MSESLHDMSESLTFHKSKRLQPLDLINLFPLWITPTKVFTKFFTKGFTSTCTHAHAGTQAQAGARERRVLSVPPVGGKQQRFALPPKGRQAALKTRSGAFFTPGGGACRSPSQNGATRPFCPAHPHGGCRPRRFAPAPLLVCLPERKKPGVGQASRAYHQRMKRILL